MGEIKIRPAESVDFEAVYEKVSELEGWHFDKGAFENIYKDNLNNQDIYYLVAENKGEVVGFVSLHIQNLLHHAGGVAEVQELYVDENLRGRGIGAKLLKYAKTIAEENNCKIFELSCNLKRLDAHRFYEKEGLKKTHYKFTKKNS